MEALPLVATRMKEAETHGRLPARSRLLGAAGLVIGSALVGHAIALNLLVEGRELGQGVFVQAGWPGGVLRELDGAAHGVLH